MKKIAGILLCVAGIVSSQSVFSSYEAANRLAWDDIIVQRWSITDYRLDDFVLRQEVIGTAIKLANINLIERYICKSYYDDVTSSAPNWWACRALEVAADEWIISRANNTARPEDQITRAEALAIILWTKDLASGPANLRVDSSANDWQKMLLQKAVQNEILTFGTNFWPNIPATRGEVFTWADRLRNATPIENASSAYNNPISAWLVTQENQYVLQSMLWEWDRDADYTIFEFSNLWCGYCKRLFDDNILERITQEAPGSVRTVIGIIDGYHPVRSQSMVCAWVIWGSEAYMKAEKYFFTNYNGGWLSWFAQHMGMDQAIVDACIADEGFMDNYQMAYHIISSYGMTGTPAIMMINNETGSYQVLWGARKLQDYVDVLESL